LCKKESHTKQTKKRRKKNGKKKWEKERNRDKCDVTVHARGTTGLAPLVLQVCTIRR